MIGETFAIAHHNTYNYEANKSKREKDNKTIGAMLAPHFVNLLGINMMARVTLIAPENKNMLARFQGVRGQDFAMIMAQWYT
jgi:hypothetical protein